MLPPDSYKHGLLGLLCLAPVALGQTSKPSSISPCLTKAGIETSIKTSTTWTEDTASFQFRIPREPVAIAHVKNKKEVAAALSCATSASAKVSVLGRGHSFQGYGFGNAGNLVIDMSAFTEYSFDKATNQLTYGGGSQVGPASKYLWDTQKRHFPHVRGSHVGLVGSSFGGGFGTTSRLLGIPSDNLVNLEYMLYNGTIVNAGPGSDLLWAAQGAGANFGVVLSATTKTFSVPQDSLTFTISLGNVTTAVAASTLLEIQKWALNKKTPDALALRYQLMDFSTLGYFYGPEKDFDAAIAPLVKSIRAVVPAANLTKTTFPTFWDSELNSVGAGMASPTGGVRGGRASLVQSWVVTNKTPFNLQQATALIEGYVGITKRNDITGFGFLDLWGGVSRDVTDNEHAFAHGNNLWLARVDGVGAGGIWPSDGNAFMQNLFAPLETALKKTAPLRSFVNYVNSELTVKDWSARLYGKNFAKLQRIKAAVDPKAVFSGYGLAIPAAGKRS